MTRASSSSLSPTSRPIRVCAANSYSARHSQPIRRISNSRSRAGSAARGATLYVTLEPCAHVGRTPPCLDAVLAAGLSRVVVGMRDPDPRTRGTSLRRLRRAGVSLRVGVEQQLVERELVHGFGQPQHDAVVAPHHVDVVSVDLTEAVGERHGPGGVHPGAEGGVVASEQ